ncbi:DUF2239 domain-containing protein [Achromobacter spanius]|uniref:DUF2239 domain-containing protein n=1 Tax=Achromobacter spanius TaxID=217203 RepID=A0A2S5GS09_9BURK|nr:DUF2239 family protein [Achromobacter spanius]PPA75631.1 DUF2239 domain-containing protein [Achromobacter spanius]
MTASDHSPAPTYTAFEGYRILAAGPLADVALAVKRAMDADAAQALLVYQDGSGTQTDLNLSGSDAQVADRYRSPDGAAPESSEISDSAALAPRGRGRPKLGVVAREVTLLPRHWEWLGAQPGGASVALRKLVEQARRDNDAQGRQRQRQEAAYRFMASMAGNLPGFEEATRALYADDRDRYVRCVATWPEDVRGYAMRLAWDAPTPRPQP